MDYYKKNQKFKQLKKKQLLLFKIQKQMKKNKD